MPATTNDKPNESTRLLQDSVRLVRDTEELGYHTEAQLRYQNEQLNETNNHVCTFTKCSLVLKQICIYI